MPSMPSVDTFATTSNTPRVLRRVAGNPSLTDTIKQQTKGPDSVADTAPPKHIAMNQNYPMQSPGFVLPCAFCGRSATMPVTRLDNHPAGQPQQRNVLRKRRPSEASKGTSPSTVRRIMNHWWCGCSPSVSTESHLFIGEPYDPVHLAEGPKGQDIKMVRWEIPIVHITRAPTIDQHKINTPRSGSKSRTKSMGGVHSLCLTVGDALRTPGNREPPRGNFLPPTVPPRNSSRLQTGEEEAAIKHQMKLANERARARHLKYLETIGHESKVSSKTIGELGGNSPCPAVGLKVSENALATSYVHELPATPPPVLHGLHELHATSTTPLAQLHGESALLLPHPQPFRATIDLEGLLDDVRVEPSELDAHPHNPTDMPLEEQGFEATELPGSQSFHYGKSRIEAVPRTFRVPLSSSEVQGSELLDALNLNTWDWCSIPDLQPQNPRTM